MLYILSCMADSSTEISRQFLCSSDKRIKHTYFLRSLTEPEARKPSRPSLGVIH